MIFYISYYKKPEIVIQPIRTNYKIPARETVGNIYVYATPSGMDSKNYQWFKDGQKITTLYPTTLFIPSMKEEDSGEYYCIVTNECGSDTSKKFKIRVVPLGMYLSADDKLVSDVGLFAPIPNPVTSITTISFLFTK